MYGDLERKLLLTSSEHKISELGQQRPAKRLRLSAHQEASQGRRRRKAGGRRRPAWRSSSRRGRPRAATCLALPAPRRPRRLPPDPPARHHLSPSPVTTCVKLRSCSWPTLRRARVAWQATGGGDTEGRRRSLLCRPWKGKQEENGAPIRHILS